jgi:sucrose-6-phosphate hydrolase SacC (GH32 family)
MFIGCVLFLMQAFAVAGLPGLFGVADNDIVFESFETDRYFGWEVSGTAFGGAPALGRIKTQREVDGFVGKGLVNSYLGGDKATGKMLSKPFKIERNWIRFLIGGGNQPGLLGIRLWVGDSIVRSETGVDSEILVSKYWEVKDLVGKVARIEIVDEATGGWGHVLVDEIVFSNLKPIEKKECLRWVKVTGDFLQLPLMQRDKGAKAGVERLTIEQKSADAQKGKEGDRWNVMRYVHLEFPGPAKKPDFWYSYDMRAFKGQEVLLRFKSYDTTILNRLEFSDKELIEPKVYEGKYRPHFHFSPRIGWMNDVNGVYYLNGEYHLFYQANPTTAGRSTGFDMHWGHSVSTDLLHWQEWPIALFPNELPGQAGKCYSGTAVVVHKKVPAPVLFFTANSNQLMATTSDKGRTWDRYPGNPVLPVIGKASRDPKVFWHEESKSYVMILYVDKEPDGRVEGYRFFRSADLVHWKQASIIDNWYECPEFIPVRSAVTGENLWMLYGCYRPAGGPKYTSAYQLGKFDGYKFVPLSEVQPAHGGTSFYGALCYANEPLGRNVMMAWMKKTEFPGENFNQCATVPLLLSLKNKGGVDRLCFEPVSEVSRLRQTPVIKMKQVTTESLNGAFNKLRPNDCLDIVLQLLPLNGKSIKLRIRDKEWVLKDQSVGFEKETRTLHTQGAVEVRILLDRGVEEGFRAFRFHVQGCDCRCQAQGQGRQGLTNRVRPL